jgi:hypothetical protein
MLDLLEIEFNYFSMYGIFDIISQVTGLKSLRGLMSFFIFCLIIFS